jgi:ELWxxDGT repeat protein
MPGAGSSNPFLLESPTPPLRFLAVDALGLSSWEIGGSKPGVARIATLGSGVQGSSSNPYDMIDVGGRLCFFTNSRHYGEMSQLWTSDGTEAGTQKLQVLEPTSTVEPTDVGAVASVAIGEHLFVVGSTNLSGGYTKLYRLDLVDSGLQPLTDTSPSAQVAVGQTLFFTLNFSELWKAGVGSDQVERVATFDGAISSLKASQNLLFLSVANGTTFSLWRGDGTESGTAKIWSSSGPAERLTDADGSLYFTSYDYVSKETSLWIVPRGAPAAVLVQTFPLDPNFGDPFSNLTAAGGWLFFLRINPQSRLEELWRSDGTGPGTILLTDAEVAQGTLRYDGSQLFFVATTAAEGSELWRSDGTPHGTSLVKDINPGFSDSRPAELTVIDGVLFFSADDGLNGREAWRSDGTPDGTYILQDICPGACSSDPGGFTKSGPWIYFSANDGISGNELWAMPAFISNTSRPAPSPVGNQRKPRSLNSR